MMSEQIHSALIEAAEPLGVTLGNALRQVGPVSLPRRDHIDFPVYLARAVAGQQLSVKAAQSIWARVEAENAGLELSEAFCASRSEQLRQCGLSGAKVKTLVAIGEAVARDHLCVKTLKAMSPTDRAARLIEIWGVGQWTADMANIFWFGEADIWPDGDVTARKTLERLTSKRRKTVRTAERFAPYRSYLTLSMWQFADASPAG